MVELNLGIPEEKPKTKKYEKHYRAKYVWRRQKKKNKTYERITEGIPKKSSFLYYKARMARKFLKFGNADIEQQEFHWFKRQNAIRQCKCW